jgi:hypothetical protein
MTDPTHFTVTVTTRKRKKKKSKKLSSSEKRKCDDDDVDDHDDTVTKQQQQQQPIIKLSAASNRPKMKKRNKKKRRKISDDCNEKIESDDCNNSSNNNMETKTRIANNEVSGMLLFLSISFHIRHTSKQCMYRSRLGLTLIVFVRSKIVLEDIISYLAEEILFCMYCGFWMKLLIAREYINPKWKYVLRVFESNFIFHFHKFNIFSFSWGTVLKIMGGCDV